MTLIFDGAVQNFGERSEKKLRSKFSQESGHFKKIIREKGLYCFQ